MAGTLREGVRLYRMKRWEAALQVLLQVDSERFEADDKAELAYYLGLCCTKMERYDEAQIYLEQVLTLGRDTLRTCQCRMMLAYIYIITRQPKMAVYELTRLTSRGFESAQLYCTLAYAAWTQRQHKRAVECYEKALDLDRFNTTALNGLGYILVDTGTDLFRGLRYCRKAVDLKGDHAAYLDSLGWAYYKNGNLPEARTWLRRAQNLAPKAEEIQAHVRIAEGKTV